jgi:hypothetical protein
MQVSVENDNTSCKIIINMFNYSSRHITRFN